MSPHHSDLLTVRNDIYNHKVCTINTFFWKLCQLKNKENNFSHRLPLYNPWSEFSDI